MAPTAVLSIRRAIIGEVSDFVVAAGFQHFEVGIVAELVFLLSAYREEEQPLFPEVFLIEGDTFDQVLATIAPATDRLPVGSAPTGNSVAAKVLKDCASLATGGWSIYMKCHRNEVSYGLFRSFESPISISAREFLGDLASPLSGVILIGNCASNCVHLHSGNGHQIELSLTSAIPSAVPASEQVSRIVSSAVSGLDRSSIELMTPYLMRVFSGILRQSHGALIAVVSSETQELGELFKDGVVLESPLDLHLPMAQFSANGDAASLSKVQATESLLKGMVCSDGITILGSDATVRAFRVFVKPSHEETDSLANLNVRGGARARAFALLKCRIGQHLLSAFFRSQDGQSECAVTND